MSALKRLLFEDTLEILTASIKFNFVKSLLILLSTIATYLVGADNYKLLIALLTLIIIDLVTALLRELNKRRAIKSAKLGKTASKILVYTGVISAANIFGNSLQLTEVEKLLIIYYIAIEAYSITENADAMGVPIPEFFKKAIRGKIDEGNK